jgi:hypothetical protein
LLTFAVEVQLILHLILVLRLLDTDSQDLENSGEGVSSAFLDFYGNLLDGLIAEVEGCFDNDEFILVEMIVVHGEKFVDKVNDGVHVVKLCVLEVLTQILHVFECKFPGELLFIVIFEGVLARDTHSTQYLEDAIDRFPLALVVDLPWQQYIIRVLEKVLHEADIT